MSWYAAPTVLPGRPIAGPGDALDEWSPPRVPSRSPRTSRRRVLGALLLVVLVAVLAVAVRPLTQSKATTRAVHLSTPPVVAGYPRITSPALATTTSGVIRRLVAQGVRHPVAAIYGNAGQPKLFVAGGDKGPGVPAVDAAAALAGVTRTAGLLLGPVRVESTGGAPGVLRCATGTANTVPVTVCAWADGSTLGIATVYADAVQHAVGLVRLARSDIEG